MARRIIIDTDPGHDDALAIMLAVASPAELDVMALTTVAGNVPLEKTAHNALRLRELLGADMPIYRGCVRPMVNDLVTAEYVHGESGLDGPQLPEPTRDAETAHAVDYLVSTLRDSPSRGTTVCLLGPMTNLGMALVKDPTIATRIDELVIMGGSFRAGGNITPTAEFNVFVDPHAAHVVFTSGVPLTIMPLDVTHQAQATPPRAAAFRALGDPIGPVVGAMLDFVERFDIARYGFAGYPLHDPTVIAYLLAPELFAGQAAHVSVVLEAGVGHGMTVADWFSRSTAELNATVMTDVDADAYFELLTDRLGAL